MQRATISPLNPSIRDLNGGHGLLDKTLQAFRHFYGACCLRFEPRGSMKSKMLFIACLIVVTSSSSTFMLAQQLSSSAGSQPIPNESASQAAGGWPTPEEI